MNNKEYLRQAKERLGHDNKLRKEGAKQELKKLKRYFLEFGGMGDISTYIEARLVDLERKEK